MKNLSLIAVLALFAALVLSACGGKSDADIKKEVDGRTKNPAITSTVKDGVVTLTGTVETSEASKAAEAAAKGEGVKSVTNNLQIKPAAMPMMTPATMPMASPMMSPGKPMANAAKK